MAEERFNQLLTDNACRRWVFTLNNPALDHEAVTIPERFTERITAMEFGCESAPTTGTPHYQGNLLLSGRGMRKKQVLELLSEVFDQDTVYVAPMRAKTPKQAWDYLREEIKKPHCIHSFGDDNAWQTAAQGRRSDLQDFADSLVTEGLRTSALAHPTSYLRYSRGAVSLLALVPRPIFRASLVSVELHLGLPGSGKTRSAVAGRDDSQVHLIAAGAGKLWLNGYLDQPTILLDEFRGQFDLATLLQFTDPGYHQLFEIKGGTVRSNWDTCIITTNYHPVLWYTWDAHDRVPDRWISYAALTRRFAVVNIHAGHDVVRQYTPGQPQWLAFWAWRPFVDAPVRDGIGSRSIPNVIDPFDL